MPGFPAPSKTAFRGRNVGWTRIGSAQTPGGRLPRS